ncbi:helix-turn-helix domain-containing protein [Enterococcus avium]|uniref:helix-turn-helix domain-containing protein n=1 Tax=Enterococcus avium TaxID=33945 RepID=UPI0026FA79AD|nr:winged helix-turn-helix domain-containing protein [Enterococcus avium]MDO7798981.1 winged helix-turn-helix domain-containing protein [Enterococcus avium]
MGQILLLTKNTLIEQQFEQKLLRLGHEVLLSSLLIEGLLLDNIPSDFIKMFELVILSESIDNSETEDLLKKLTPFPLRVLRKSNEQIEEEIFQEWKELGIDDWIVINPDTELLREKVSCKRTIKAGKVVLLPTIKEKIPLSNISLSAAESKLFMILYEQQNNILSREELCYEMWEREQSNSTMSQLSVMVKRLKDKLSKQNVEGPIIKTCWGKGYKLDESVYDQVYLDSLQVKYVNK